MLATTEGTCVIVLIQEEKCKYFSKAKRYRHHLLQSMPDKAVQCFTFNYEKVSGARLQYYDEMNQSITPLPSPFFTSQVISFTLPVDTVRYRVSERWTQMDSCVSCSSDGNDVFISRAASGGIQPWANSKVFIRWQIFK